jgi:HlyD family secretion protein
MAKAKKKTRRRIIIFSLMGVVLIAVVVVVVLRRREVPITVQTEPVTRRNLTELVAANGKIQPVVQVVINPEISGEIIALPVKEGQKVKPGDLLVKIKPDNYVANTNSAFAQLQGALSAQELARANQAKAEWEFQRVGKMYEEKLISEFEFQATKTTLEVARAQYESSIQQVKQSRANLARAMEDLAKTTIMSPIDGTVTKLKSQVGERVVGSTMMAGTEIMTLANLDDMEARVDIGEIDVVLIQVKQKARLEVDAFRDRKFNGTVTEISNSSKSGGSMGSGSSQEATKFEVKIRINEKEAFRPGMSVTSDGEGTNQVDKARAAEGTNASAAAEADHSTAATNAAETAGTNAPAKTSGKKPGEPPKPIQVVFVVEGDRVKMVQVKTGISDDSHMEIIEGLEEGQKVVSGKIGAVGPEPEKK